jgi:membrane protease YdiL (CAAX protease family)
MVTEKAFSSQIFVENKTDMKLLYMLLMVGIATVLLLTMGTFTNKIPLQIHPNSFVDGLAKYQIVALIVGVSITIAMLILNPESKQFLRIGKLGTIAEKEKWLGINGKSSWAVNGLQLVFFISIATGIFMFLAIKYTNSLYNFQWSFIPLILLFSLTNSLTEELIFRFAIVGGLFNHYSKLTILIVSAVLFGLPHYFGSPSGVIGILMSGVLGYVLCKATVETKGISIAWTIHFVQDIIIFTALMMINVKGNTF